VTYNKNCNFKHYNFTADAGIEARELILRNAIVQNADDRPLYDDFEFASHRDAPTRALADRPAIGFAQPRRLRSGNHRHNSRQKIAFGHVAIMDR
jgi:hypothetical protein